MFYKKAVPKNFSIFAGKHLCWSLFLIKLQVFRYVTSIIKRIQHRCFFYKHKHSEIFKNVFFWRKSVNGCFWIMSTQNFHSFIWRLQIRCSYNCFFNTCRKTSVLECTFLYLFYNLNLSLFKKRLRRWCLADSYLKLLTTTFLTHNKLWKKHCYKKRGSDIYHKFTYATFHHKLQQDYYISESDNGLYKVLPVERKSLKVVNNTLTIGVWSLTCQTLMQWLSHWYSWQTWLIAMHCFHETTQFFTIFAEYF